MVTFESFINKFNEFRDSGAEFRKTAFLYGVVVNSRHLLNGEKHLTKLYFDAGHSLFTEDFKEAFPIILKTWSGEDDSGQSEMDYKEEGMPSLLYMLERAKEMGRPDYCLFFILGLIRGYANSQWINKSEIKELVASFPSHYMQKHYERASEWFNYFDEVGICL